MWLADDGIWLTFLPSGEEQTSGGGRGASRLADDDPAGAGQSASVSQSAVGVNIRLSFSGANLRPSAVTHQRLETKINYFLGDDSTMWRAEVPTWGSVDLIDLYPGLDLRLGSNENGWTWQLAAGEGASPSPARLQVDGANDVSVRDNQLLLVLPDRQVTLPLPSSDAPYEVVTSHGVQTVMVAAPQQTAGETASDTPGHAPGDLLFSTFLGGQDGEPGRAVALDSAGRSYVAGWVESSNFPTTPGTFDPSLSGVLDAFVARLSTSGSSLEYATFLGGNGREGSQSIGVDGSGRAYVAGWSDSTDFPTTAGAFDRSYNGGGNDTFVVRLNATGSALDYATYLGGADWDKAVAVAVDSNNRAYVAGYGYSTDYPTTPGAFDQTANGGRDGFVTRLNAAGSALEYSSYYGGSGGDWIHALAVDSNSRLVVAGYTDSSNLPVTAGAFDTIYGGQTDGYVARFNSAGSGLDYASFIGGSAYDAAFAVAVDASSQVHVAGETDSSNFPTTPGAFDRSLGGVPDAFVVKLNASGSNLVYGTYLGGAASDLGIGIAIGDSGQALLTGYTGSSDFPTTPDGFDRSINGGTDAFVVVLNSAGSALNYASFLGGGNDDAGYGVASAAANAVIVVGGARSSDFPTTPGAYDRSHNGNEDVFVAKLEFRLTATPTPTATPTRTPTTTPDPGSTIDVDLCVGETYTQRVDVFIPQAPARADVMFAFDTTYSMVGVLSSAKTNAITIMNNLAGLIPDVNFAVVDLRDYPFAPLGDPGDWPYRLRQPMTSNYSLVQSAISATSAGGGADYPESYSRALYESYADSAIGWRSDARRFLVMFGDDVPHDDDLNAGISSPPVNPGGVWCGVTSAGCVRDPGRDGMLNTADDLDFQTVLSQMATQQVTLLYVASGGGSTSQANLVTYWRHWAQRTAVGGDALPLDNASSLPSVIQSLVSSAAQNIGRLNLQASPSTYQTWITTTPPEYTNLTIPPGGLTKSFDLAITPPDGVSPNVYTFQIKAMGDGAVYKTLNVTVDVQSCGPPTITPGPGTPTATPPLPTPTATPSFPRCSLTVDKIAYPSSVRIDSQVGVTLRLTGDCADDIGAAVDVTLVVDRSASMCGDKLVQAQAAGQTFLQNMALPPDQASVVSFSGTSTLHTGLTTNRSQASNALYNIVCGGISRIDAGLNGAFNEMTGPRRVAGHTPAVILLTDGNPQGSYSDDVRAAAQRIRAAGIQLYTVGLGGNANTALLREIATAPDHFYQSPTPVDLAEIYNRLASEMRAVPAANVNLTDIVAPQFDIVPGAWSGAGTPHVNGQTLTWHISRIEEGVTEVGFVVRPRQCGTFAVNQSALASFDDNRGSRRNVAFPVPTINVTGCSGTTTDIFIADNVMDSGVVPSSPPWWDSPDVWVRRADDGATQHQNPQMGRRNYVYARVLNRGATTIANIDVTFFYGASGLGLGWPAGWNQLPTTRRIASLAPGASAVVSIPWDVPNIAGHFCLRVHITAAQDPLLDYRVDWENNIAQRNFHVVEYPQPPDGACRFDGGTFTDTMHFDVINTLNTSTMVDLQISAVGLSDSARIWVDPAALAGRWTSLDGLVAEPNGLLRVTRLPATIYGVRMNPHEIRQVQIEITAPANDRFTVAIAETVRGNLVGGNSYQRTLPACPSWLPVVLVQREARGAVTGVVVNAVNNQPIAGASVCVVGASLCATTDSQGRYTINNVPAGNREVRASAGGYVTLTQSVIVPYNASVTLNFALTPNLAVGEMRVVLTWGATPSDLDSHLWLPASTPFHVRWNHRGNCTAFPYACLDVDDVTSYGPETITIKQRYNGTYVYAVYQWSSSGALTSSGARVQVYNTNGLLREFRVPTSGSGRWWYVFDLNGASGAITDRNFITASSPGPYDPSPSNLPEGSDKQTENAAP